MSRTRTIAIADITIDESIQQRAEGTDPVRVAEYAADIERGDEFPPVVVYEIARLTFLLSQGFTRIAALLLLGRTHVKAEVRQGSRRDAIVDACGANAEHGARRTTKDKRRAVATLCELFPNRSTRWIAEKAKVSHMTVDRYRQQVEQSDNSHQGGDDADDADEDETVTGTDGRQYKAHCWRNLT